MLELTFANGDPFFVFTEQIAAMENQYTFTSASAPGPQPATVIYLSGQSNGRLVMQTVAQIAAMVREAQAEG